MAEALYLAEDCCNLCGKYPMVDIDGCESPHQCSDSVLRWTDGKAVDEQLTHPMNELAVEEDLDGNHIQANRKKSILFRCREACADAWSFAEILAWIFSSRVDNFRIFPREGWKMETLESRAIDKKSIKTKYNEACDDVKDLANIFFWVFCMWIENILDCFNEKVIKPIVLWVSKNQYTTYLIVLTFVAIGMVLMLAHLKP